MSASRKTALITGASKGIGRAISDELSLAGYHVLGLARHANYSDFPGDLVACDLADIRQTENVLKRIVSAHEVSIVVNNAGIASPQPLGEIDIETLNSVLDLNVRVAVQVTQHAVAGMKERRFGRIINMCSRAIQGARDRTAYSAAKAALAGCTRTWALELAEFGITSNAIAPGPIETELFRQARPVGSEGEKTILSTIPMQRLGTSEEVAALVTFLVSDKAGFISGQVIGVDGAGGLGGS